MSDDERLSDLDRRSLKILARSSKTSGSGDRLSQRLERAAETGSRSDYEKAEQTFDSLPAEDRARIGTKAEKQATTERELIVRRRRATSAPPAPPRPATDDALEWKPIFAPAPEAADVEIPVRKKKRPAAAKAAAKKAEAEPPQGQSWELGRMPGNPKMPKAGSMPPKPPSRPVVQMAEDQDPEDEQKDWDWRKLPDDPVLSGTRKKQTGPVDPIEELRRQMLGLDAKYGKR